MDRTEEFFNMLGKNLNENIYQLNDKFRQLNTSIKTAVAERQQNIYYAVNDFPVFGNGYINRRQNKVQRFNAFYTDIDIKDDNNNHLQEADLQQHKQDIFTKLLALPLPPSAIIESKNGYHTYWIINKDARQDCIPMRWRRLEGCIYHYIHDNISNGADSKATDATRVLRCPNSYHVKADNTSPFLVEVKYLSRSYTLMELEEHFPAVEIVDESTKDKEKKQEKPQEVRALEPATADIYTAINELDSEFFNYIQPINAEMGWREAEECLKRQDIRDFLGISVKLRESFCSVLRQDKTPSCCIYNNNGKYMYCDFGVGFTADLIRLVSKTAGIKYSKAVKWLCGVYGIQLLDTYQNGKTPIEPLISENMDIITKTAKEAEARGIFFVSSVIDLYRCIMEIWKKQVEQYNINNPSDCRLMLASRYLEDLMGKDRKTIRRQLLILQAIGCIKKVANSKIKKAKFGDKANSYMIMELNSTEILQKAQDLVKFCPSPLSKLTEKNYKLFSCSNYWGDNLDL